MKKQIVTAVASMFFFAALVVPSSAQSANVDVANDTANNAYHNNNSTYNANSVRTNAVDNDNDMDWGWIGLLGLLGLAGMRKRVSDHK
ncbi:WGxxGxxG-CTERM domain-containing protein [Paenibacillus polymyxa]|uniref:MYXO-CTERM domain-containing protein n=1 Tax=Paenibacillus polymyxa TaxID=1406 RepID=A0A378Y009_PAEPO|nr:WGxxGxxG family protein [Paenibacillus polymyxa]MBE7900683.1 WGxxGxxG-CTERM domain-containing protein [Paenibacillus polymyxa]MBG9764016.1 hypothetical protein [Paenibacillus polymyxa]MCC3261166.1 WGxxGxxG-CTERM domain-containing protein [Paenibacillus polymyxa]QPK55304.1 WGxxGxxG-CTERM domain-containing protein [Paenibacillus polymyxa]QPK60389.1 WGxxGxxG-CTERM domain-containing protein [Paenibacillus polymyxa]